MLSPEELRRLIAAEFLRVGASQQSWDQNFPEYGPSQWIPGPGGVPVIDPDYVARIIPATGSTNPDPDGSDLICPAGTIKEYINGRWQCTAVGGRVVDPEAELYPPISSPVSGGPRPSGLSALPAFVGGNLGKVQFTTIANRNITGVRFGVLPRVIFDEVPGDFGLREGVASYSGVPGSGAGSENIDA